MISQAQQHAEIADHIRRFGWHCLHVHPNKATQNLFSYSIGFVATYEAPEIIIFGLETKKAHALLTECASVLAAGSTFPIDVRDTRVLTEPFEVVLKPVRESCLDYYCGTARRFYATREMRASVMILPDKGNRFPWDEAYAGMDQAEALSLV